MPYHSYRRQYSSEDFTNINQAAELEQDIRQARQSAIDLYLTLPIPYEKYQRYLRRLAILSGMPARKAIPAEYLDDLELIAELEPPSQI